MKRKLEQQEYEKEGFMWKNNRGPFGNGHSRCPRTFTKLLKDKNALVRNRTDADRFIEGMEFWGSENATNLLTKLDDSRDEGTRRIREILSFIDSIDTVECILVRFLKQVMTVETERPLFVPLRNRVLSRVFHVPTLLQTVMDLEAPLLLPQESAQVLCRFLQAISSYLLDARRDEFVVSMAKQYEGRADVDSRALRSLVLADAVLLGHVPSVATAPKPETALWVADERPPGGRHDNDQLNFRNIRILPTSQELQCATRPWLPLASGANNFVEDPTLRLISNNFRLLREDAVFSMKEKIQGDYRPWTNTRIIDINISVKRGLVAFVVQCDPKKQKFNWQFSRSLSHGSVVVLCRGGFPHLLGTICTRELEGLKSEGGPKIGVSFDMDGGHFNNALDSLIKSALIIREQKRYLGRDGGKHLESFRMIEASTSYATYQPVLHSLQMMTEIPFVEELCEQDLRHGTSSLTYLPDILRMPEDEICNGHTLDFNSTTGEELCSATKLDMSQAMALLHAFSTRVSLIQGPPGTGR
jgi:hypothetical protein